MGLYSSSKHRFRSPVTPAKEKPRSAQIGPLGKGAKVAYSSPTYFIGHVKDGKVFYDTEYGSSGDRDVIMLKATGLPWSASRIIIMNRSMTRHGVVFGILATYSTLDGKNLEI